VLGIDIGNTNIVIGYYEHKELRGHWRIASDRTKTADEYAVLIKALFVDKNIPIDHVDDIIISSVVPPINTVFEEMCSRYFHVDPVFVSCHLKLPIRIETDNPEEVGSDRITNAVAAYHLYGGPVIIVDYGTATTVCAVSADGAYLGGAIAPGGWISMEALFQRTAKLPRIQLQDPGCAIGKNTVASMQSGAFYGFAGQIDYLLQRFRAELRADATVVVTGGLGKTLAEGLQTPHEVNPLLTLEGLRLIREFQLT